MYFKDVSLNYFQGPVQLKFERVKPGSLPPKFHEITFEAASDNKYVSCMV